MTSRWALTRPIATITWSLIGAALTIVALQWGQLSAGRNPLSGLRTLFWYDQLGYLAIAANVRSGHIELTEPVSMTGVSHYPAFYYSMVGEVARLLDVETITAWNFLALSLQFSAALALGLVSSSLARRAWVGVLAPIPFLTGTFAYAIAGADRWYTTLDAHAVLWGPWGVLFSANAESAALCVLIIVFSVLFWVWSRPSRRHSRAIVTVLGAAIVGALSSFQTYSFLSGIYLLCYVTAAAGILFAVRRSALLIMSAALLVGVFAFGPTLSGSLGQLPVLAVGIFPALPGVVIAIIRTRGLVAFAGAALTATAAPQIIRTALGSASGDPFLTYRVSSNVGLGVVSWDALLGAAVPLLILILVITVSLRMRDRLTLAVATGSIIALVILCINDVWGANAEPYRFWIDGILLAGVVGMLCLARLGGSAWPRGESDGTRPHAGRRLLAVGLVIVAVVWAAALPDLVNAWNDPKFNAVWNSHTERQHAIASAAERAAEGSGLIVTELCVDNRTAKVLSGAAFAYYHLGMAWPADKTDIDKVIDARDARALDFDAMAGANVEWVITDTNCDSDWAMRYSDDLREIATFDYRLHPSAETVDAGKSADGEIQLWHVRDDDAR
ncbi:hypothetical protein [uncultured Microbacterium sp.]|uniref:hypothetical protein n=1 Tax=uncultured Microbacterium sp. TaxID=191216 RepID=UPI00261790A8|nr:hypothetical protein [uncultured Microbacterium sp.]